MNVDKSSFYRNAAKGFSASTLLYKVDSVVHVEAEDDIWFWRQILSKYRPVKYKFIAGSLNAKNQFTTGCCQCLKYKDYLSQRFFICIDSDLRYLLNEDISAAKGILQTYTYSWENHCCFADKLQEKFEELTKKRDIFDFRAFLKNFSMILHKPFIFMLYNERNGLTSFDRIQFKNLISLQLKSGDEQNNGHALLKRLADTIEQTISPLYTSFDFEKEANYYADKGVFPDNVYLYIRGHSLYNIINIIGNHLCYNTGVDFEGNILKSAILFEEYYAIDKIKNDIPILNNIRHKY